MLDWIDPPSVRFLLYSLGWFVAISSPSSPSLLFERDEMQLRFTILPYHRMYYTSNQRVEL